MEADQEQEYEHKNETELNFSLFNVTYKNMLTMEKMEYMVHHCHKCPTYTALREYVELKLQEYDIEEDVTYSQEDSTNRTTLRTHKTPVDEFIELLAYHIHNLSKHSFIVKNQAQYLKARKEEIDEETCIILLDFTENYHFIVQDEVQGYYWNKDQYTLHTVVIYYKNHQNQLIHKSVCILSDNLDHDTSFVHELQSWYAILFKKHLKSSILSIGAMVVQANRRTSKILWICATMWMTLCFMLFGCSLPEVTTSPHVMVLEEQWRGR